MLLHLNKNPSVGSVIAVKLVSGQELIGKLTATSDTEVTIDRPLVLEMVPGPNGQAFVSFVPFMVGVELNIEITIKVDKFLAMPVEARQDAAKQYLQTTTGIAL